jgi:hypothetical protein
MGQYQHNGNRGSLQLKRICAHILKRISIPFADIQELVQPHMQQYLMRALHNAVGFSGDVKIQITQFSGSIIWL